MVTPPPSAESRSPAIKIQFTLNMAKKYTRIEEFIVFLSKMSGIKSTFSGRCQYKFGFNRKLIDWKGTDWQGFELTDLSS